MTRRPALRHALAATAVLLLSTASPRIARADKCPQMLIVFDRTLSMLNELASGEVKWDVVGKAVKSFTGKYNKSIRFGFEYFNGIGCKNPLPPAPDGLACTPGCLLFDPKDDAAADVRAAIDALMPSGQTPTWETMEALKDYAPLKDPGYSNFILLMTDGLPNCLDPRAADGKYLGERSIAAIKALHDAGVPVFVLGVGTMGGAGGGALDPEILDKMAEAGGVAQGAPATHKFYAADNPKEVDAALEAIAGRAGGATIGGCISGGSGAGGAGGSNDAGGGGAGQTDAGGQGGGGGAAGHGGPGAERGTPGCMCTLAGGDAPPAQALRGAALLVAAAVLIRTRSARRRARR